MQTFFAVSQSRPGQPPFIAAIFTAREDAQRWADDQSTITGSYTYAVHDWLLPAETFEFEE